MARAFRKILIANRGEIACRVMRTARAAGYRTVAVYSEADRDARHVRLADEAVLIGPAPVAQSYLDPTRILAAAKRSGAEAVHPGYGFLSENAGFAQACVDAGLVFIGPSPEAIRAMGDKAEAKRRMIAAGVPCVPGYQGADQNDATLAAEADRIGYPVMVKAAAGGGGRGMRLVERKGDLAAALRTARSEAKHAFGDDTMLLERAIAAPRHVEIQVFGDTHGAVIHLGERDCSVQRRHQKVIEEAPSPAVDAELRRRMGEAAVEAARAIAYVGAGTVEFLLDAASEFYFLEMNTRLQVEHPVTELIADLDLVALQLDVAAGKPLPIRQEDVTLVGHAIEVRLYAEDAAQGFLPQTGTVHVWEPACGEGVRVDHGLAAGAIVSPFYDPLLAKIIAWGADRAEARRRLMRAVEDTIVLGVTTNKDFLLAALENETFIAGEATTDFIRAQFGNGFARSRKVRAQVTALAACLLVDRQGETLRSSQWHSHPILLRDGGETLRLSARRDGAGWTVEADGETVHVCIVERAECFVRYEAAGLMATAHYAQIDDRLYIDGGGHVWSFEDVTYAPPAAAAGAADGLLRAPMSGSVIAVDVAPGDRVKRGQVVVIIEAMKMEHEIVAPADGIVESVAVARGAQVGARDVLVKVAAAA